MDKISLGECTEIIFSPGQQPPLQDSEKDGDLVQHDPDGERMRLGCRGLTTLLRILQLVARPWCQEDAKQGSPGHAEGRNQTEVRSLQVSPRDRTRSPRADTGK